jgi:Excalibur calcium-binding domain
VKRLLVIALIALLSLGAWGVRPAGAATRYPTYKNCTEMHKRYKGGVARVGARDNKRAKYKPYVNTGLYNANKKSDRDKDGIACEQ